MLVDAAIDPASKALLKDDPRAKIVADKLPKDGLALVYFGDMDAAPPAAPGAAPAAGAKKDATPAPAAAKTDKEKDKDKSSKGSDSSSSSKKD